LNRPNHAYYNVPTVTASERIRDERTPSPPGEIQASALSDQYLAASVDEGGQQ
jgi:hypothetical protein